MHKSTLSYSTKINRNAISYVGMYDFLDHIKNFMRKILQNDTASKII